MTAAADPTPSRPVRDATSGPGLWLPLAMAAVGGGAMFCAFPPVDVGELAWVALPLFALGLTQCRRPGWGALAGLVFGLSFYGPLLSYISAFGVLPWALVVVMESVFLAALGYLATQLNPLGRPLLRAAAFAALWVLVEYLREHRGAVSLTLGDAYYSQWGQPSLLQLASLGGGHFISFLMVLLSSALAIAAVAWLPARLHRPAAIGPAFRRDAARALVFCYFLFFAAFFWGNWAYRRGTATVENLPEHLAFRVSYVQAAVPIGHTATVEEAREAAEAYLRLSDTLPRGSDLIVWPETAIPSLLEQNDEYREAVAEMARRKGSYLLAGGCETAPMDKLYNTQFLFDPTGRIVDRYRKVHLVLFGEYVPWRQQLKFLERFPIRPFDYAPGDGYKVMQAGDMRFGNLICFESLFPQYTRVLCRLGAEFIVITTSDHWAQGTYELAQHSRAEILRAVEARRYIVRVATDGESMIITPFGQRLSVLEIEEQGAQHDLVFPIKALSLYHRWGDWPLLLLCCVLWIGALRGSVGGPGRASQKAGGEAG